MNHSYVAVVRSEGRRITPRRTAKKPHLERSNFGISAPSATRIPSGQKARHRPFPITKSFILFLHAHASEPARRSHYPPFRLVFCEGGSYWPQEQSISSTSPYREGLG